MRTPEKYYHALYYIKFASSLIRCSKVPGNLHLLLEIAKCTNSIRMCHTVIVLGQCECYKIKTSILVKKFKFPSGAFLHILCVFLIELFILMLSLVLIM